MGLRDWVQRSEEHGSPGEVLEHARPYLPPEGAMGEMVLSVGKAVYLHGRGAHGVIDISPFTCMNGRAPLARGYRARLDRVGQPCPA